MMSQHIVADAGYPRPALNIAACRYCLECCLPFVGLQVVAVARRLAEISHH